MATDIQDLRDLLKQRYCCAQSLVLMGLRHKGADDNPDLLSAMKALCGGVSSGLLCGALSGAACMMNIIDPESKGNGAIKELTSWFSDDYCQKYGGINCYDITRGGTPSALACQRLIEDVYVKARELLIENGTIFNE